MNAFLMKHIRPFANDILTGKKSFSDAVNELKEIGFPDAEKLLAEVSITAKLGGVKWHYANT